MKLVLTGLVALMPGFAQAPMPLQSQALAPAFEVALVKPSAPHVAGKPWSDELIIEPGRLSGSYVSLKTLMVEAYGIQYYQIAGGPGWIESQEYSLDARAGKAVSRDEMRSMLRNLLSERFKLIVHKDSKEMKAYLLVVDKGGSKLQVAGESSAEQQAPPGVWHFRGDLAHFAGLLSIQLKIPVLDDPNTPSHASGTLVPVIDRTGLTGVYNINLAIRSDPVGDIFTVWQRALQEQLGIKLESQRVPVEMFVVEHAERATARN